MRLAGWCRPTGTAWRWSRPLRRRRLLVTDGHAVGPYLGYRLVVAAVERDHRLHAVSPVLAVPVLLAVSAAGGTASFRGFAAQQWSELTWLREVVADERRTLIWF